MVVRDVPAGTNRRAYGTRIVASLNDPLKNGGVVPARVTAEACVRCAAWATLTFRAGHFSSLLSPRRRGVTAAAYRAPATAPRRRDAGALLLFLLFCALLPRHAAGAGDEQPACLLHYGDAPGANVCRYLLWRICVFWDNVLW